MNIKAMVELKHLRIDFQHLKKTGQKIYHLNEHRAGYRYQFYWDKKRTGPIKNKFYYKFYPTRKNKRRLAQILKTDFDKDYFEK